MLSYASGSDVDSESKEKSESHTHFLAGYNSPQSVPQFHGSTQPPIIFAF